MAFFKITQKHAREILINQLGLLQASFHAFVRTS